MGKRLRTPSGGTDARQFGREVVEPTRRVADLPTRPGLDPRSPSMEPMSVRTLLMFLAALWAGAMVMPGATAAAAPQQGLFPQARIEVSAAPKRFDLMTVDSARRRLLAAHSKAGTLTVIDLAADRLEREVPVGQSSGVAIDPQDGKYFVGTTQGIAVVDRNTLRKRALFRPQVRPMRWFSIRTMIASMSGMMTTASFGSSIHGTTGSPGGSRFPADGDRSAVASPLSQYQAEQRSRRDRPRHWQDYRPMVDLADRLAARARSGPA
jgi:hypothetical protein